MPSAPRSEHERRPDDHRADGADERARKPPRRRRAILTLVIVALAGLITLLVAMLIGAPDEPMDDEPPLQEDDVAPEATGPDDDPDPAEDRPPEPPPEPVEPPAWSSVRPYSDDSPWNTPIGEGAPVHARSDELVARVGGSLTSDTSQYTLPVYEVDDDTETSTVQLDHLFSDVTADGTSLDRVQEPTVEVPVPEGAASATGTDAQIVIVNTDTGEEWGFWHLEPEGDGYRATNGYRYHVGANAVPPEGFGSRGAGVPYLAGLIRPADIERGRIDHAIAFAYPTPSPEHVFPATKSDGAGDPELDLPEGARLRLDPSLDDADFDELDLSEEARIIARALQEYGMILIDIAGRPKIYAEYDETAGWDGAITEDTVSALDLELFEVIDWEATTSGPYAQPTSPPVVPAGGDLVLDGTSSFALDGEVTAHEWTDADQRVVGEEAVVRYPTDRLEPGTHRFGLRVADDDGTWSALRHVHVEVREVDGPFVAATYEASGRDVTQLEVPTAHLREGETMLVAATLRRLNENDDVEVTRISGAGGEWERVSREIDERGTLALEIWAGEPQAAAPSDGDVRIELSSATNVAAQAISLAELGPFAGTEGADAGAEMTADSAVSIDGHAGGMVVGFTAGRTEDLTVHGDGELNVGNTMVDDEGGSVRLSSIVALPDQDGRIELAGRTRSPMDWVAAVVSYRGNGSDDVRDR